MRKGTTERRGLIPKTRREGGMCSDGTENAGVDITTPLLMWLPTKEDRISLVSDGDGRGPRRLAHRVTEASGRSAP